VSVADNETRDSVAPSVRKRRGRRSRSLVRARQGQDETVHELMMSKNGIEVDVSIYSSDEISSRAVVIPLRRGHDMRPDGVEDQTSLK